MGRKAIPLNIKLIEQLAELHLSSKSIAKISGVSQDTLHRNCADIIAKSKATSNARILSKLYEMALNDRKVFTPQVQLKAMEILMKRVPELYTEHIEVTVKDGAFQEMAEQDKLKVLALALEAKQKRMQDDGTTDGFDDETED